MLTLRASHDLAGVGSNINTSDSLVMSSQLILKLESAARFRVQVDVVLASYSQRLTVGREGVVRNWVMEEVVNFRGGHCDVELQ